MKQVICRKYKGFLLVKSIEHIAAKQRATTLLDSDSRLDRRLVTPETTADSTTAPNLDVDVNSWFKKCQPNEGVDLFWQAHILSTRKYIGDCMELVGDIIDYEDGYISPEPRRGTDFENKMVSLESLINSRSERPYDLFCSPYGGNAYNVAATLLDERAPLLNERYDGQFVDGTIEQID